MEQNQSRQSPKSSFSTLLVLFSCIVLGSLVLMSMFQDKKTAASRSVEMEETMAKNPAQRIADSAYETMRIRMAERDFIADIADTQALRELGLSGRQGLGDDEAMLFVFPTSGQNLFWMKDMLFPIDMIWLDKNKKVSHIVRDAEPSSFPQTFGPSTPTMYVIETRAGIADEIGLRIGDKVRF